jgi:hypothetical protein
MQSENFGTSPFYGQLSHQLHQLVYAYTHGDVAQQEQWRPENILACARRASAKRESSSTAAILNFERYGASLTHHSDVVCFIQTPLLTRPHTSQGRRVSHGRMGPTCDMGQGDILCRILNDCLHHVSIVPFACTLVLGAGFLGFLCVEMSSPRGEIRC